MAQYDQQKAVTAAINKHSRTAALLERQGSRNRNTHEHFQLTKKQKKVLTLLPKCGWAQRYVNLIVRLGSRCPWKPHYQGQPIDDPYLQKMIDDIRPAAASQRSMRIKALKLQTKIGLYGMTFEPAAGRIAYAVHHPLTIQQSRRNRNKIEVVKSRDDNRESIEYSAKYLRRFSKPDDMYSDECWSDLFDVLDSMERYCCALEAVDANIDQAKMFNNLLHLKLENTEKNPYWGNPASKDKQGKLLIEKSIENLNDTARDAFKHGGQARFSPYTFIWPGDLEHVKLNEPLNPEHIETLNAIALQGARDLPIPTSFISGEEGMANHWGDAENHRQLKDQTLQPELEIHDDFFDEHAFKPLLRLKHVNGKYQNCDIEDFSMASDSSAIDNKPDNSAFIFELYKEGVASRKQVADATGMECVVDLPEEVTEYDHWLTLRGKTASEPMIDPDGRSDAPEPPSIGAQAMALLTS